MSTIPPTRLIEEPIQTTDTAGQRMIAIVTHNIPPDGTFTFSVPGPDAANTISLPLGTFPGVPVMSWQVTYPANFSTTAVLAYWMGPTIPPVDANISIQVYIPVVDAAEVPTVLGEKTVNVF